MPPAAIDCQTDRLDIPPWYAHSTSYRFDNHTVKNGSLSAEIFYFIYFLSTDLNCQAIIKATESLFGIKNTAIVIALLALDNKQLALIKTTAGRTDEYDKAEQHKTISRNNTSPAYSRPRG